MSLRFEQIYGVASLQGAPLNGYRRYGVPPGGAFDQRSLALANSRAGNAISATAIEFGMAAAELRASARLRLAWAGAQCELRIDGVLIDTSTLFEVCSGNLLQIAAPSSGARGYLAVAGGWEPGLDILAISSRARLARGDVVHAGKPGDGQTARVTHPQEASEASPIAILPGPQIREELRNRFLDASFEVSHLADRVGIRLIGPQMPSAPELVSEPACPGAIQLTNGGQLVLLGPDGPTIGGYAKPAVVVAAHRDRLGQLRPGDRVHFRWVTFEESRLLAEAQ